MTLDLRDCTFAGPAMPEPFVKFRLEELLNKKKLLAKASGDASKKLQESWQTYRNKLRALGEQGGDQRVLHQVLEPLADRIGWQLLDKADPVTTREGREEGGYLLRIPPPEGEGAAPHLRAWVYPVGTDLDAPNKRGRAYRFSPGLVAQRVLLAKGERVGLLTDGLELRILLSDPSGRDSHIGIRLDRSGGWRSAREVPDSFRLLRALCQPGTSGLISDLLNEARLSQSSVTKKLREQARRAVETFIQGLLDDPANGEVRNRWSDDDEAAKELWREGLILVYRLLFILKLETSPDPARAFSFASSSLWRNSYSPSTALAPVVEKVRDHGAETGEFLAHSLRALFRLFSHGLTSNELHVSPLGGMLFGKEATPILDSLHWSEQAVAYLLDALLWTPADRRGAHEDGRERVHYGALDVEDLGRVYEALLELEPGIAGEPMCRLRRTKLEVVVPVAQGASYRTALAEKTSDQDEGFDDEDEDEDEDSGGKGRTKVLFVEEIPQGRFYLRVGLGRKASGSYYTPHPFVRFLVQETLGPQIVERSSQDDPSPLAILGLNVLDPAMGSGHFLVEACRFLGDALYEACRLCDERALDAQKKAENAKTDAEREKLLERARALWKRVEDLPDPNDELVAYLPSRVLEGEESGLSQRRALALCRRLVAVHCLYGVDKNPLAVELARVSLWLESYAEGLPLTFLEHRLICGDSLTGPFFEHLLTYPGNGERIEHLFAQGVTEKLTKVLAEALAHVRDLEATIGKDAADIELKRIAKRKLDGALQPLKVLAAAWAGGVMLGKDGCDDAGYEHILRSVAEKEGADGPASSRPGVAEMIRVGIEGVPYDLVFPEVFHLQGEPQRSGGFDALLGNPPWDKSRVEKRDLLASFDPKYLHGKEASDSLLSSADEIDREFASRPVAVALEQASRRAKAGAFAVLGISRSDDSSPINAGDPDLYQLFLLRSAALLKRRGQLGIILGGGIAKNPADAGLRSWLFKTFSVKTLAHYFNLRQLFGGASSRISFCLLHGCTSETSTSAHVALDLKEFEELLEERSFNIVPPERLGDLGKTLAQSRQTVTLEGVPDAIAAMEALGVSVGNDLHRTSAKPAFRDLRDVIDATDARAPETIAQLAALGVACLYDGRCFDFFNSQPTLKSGKWLPQVEIVACLDHPLVRSVADRSRYFRLAWRLTCGHPSTNTRSARACILPPGSLAGNSIIVETAASERPNFAALAAVAVVSSHCVDYQLRPSITSLLNKSVMRLAVWPRLDALALSFLAHSALRLSCINSAYAPLWSEQLLGRWREPGEPRAWPVIDAVDARWNLRAAVDAVVAATYGTDRIQYAEVLSAFNHRSYPKAPDLCLAAFDELGEIGIDAFVKKHDPYWDIALVTTLPTPAINLPGAGATTSGTFTLTPANAKAKRGRTKKGDTA